ncbi:hypothetical protein Clacol_008456 [Clathrus columnatus]|uniref:C2H2-type domain-containing protein n=1 Tax=Clathrus columnatus TaxID=1419009 RepID=A0AAV5AM53_9AGAM|nr:hypothetical protein Clacol_008456 [Clathrus columnatus]
MIASYDLNRNTGNNHIYAYPYASNIVGLSGDFYLQSQNSVFNNYGLPLPHQINSSSSSQEVIGDASRRGAILSTAPAADSTVPVNMKTLDIRGKGIMTDPLPKKPALSHPTTTASQFPSTLTITQNHVDSSNQIHNLVKLETVSPVSFPQLIQQTSQGFYCGLSRCPFPRKIFFSAEAVIEHIRTEDIPRSKPQAVWCSCNNWFSSKSVGQRHVRGENEGMQYKCPVAKCTRRFKRKDQIESHLRAGHPKKNPKRRKACNVVQDNEQQELRYIVGRQLFGDKCLATAPDGSIIGLLERKGKTWEKRWQQQNTEIDKVYYQMEQPDILAQDTKRLINQATRQTKRQICLSDTADCALLATEEDIETVVTYYDDHFLNVEGEDSDVEIPSGHQAVPVPLAFPSPDLDDYLMDIAHPESENYGRLWTQKQIIETFAASPETIATVKDWLILHGLDKEKIKLSSDRLWLIVEMTAQDAESLLEATYQVFEHAESACDSYSLPSHIQNHVDFVHPGTTLNAPKTSNTKRRSVSGKSNDKVSKRDTQVTLPPGFSANSTDRCDEVILPVCIRKLYDFHYDFKESKPDRIGVSIYRQEDLDGFFGIFSPDSVGNSPIFVSIDGGILQGNDSAEPISDPSESNLDLEYLMTFVHPQDVTLYQTGSLQVASDSLLNNFLDALDDTYCSFEGGDDPSVDAVFPESQPGGFQGPADCGTVKPANVISISYGAPESTFSAFYLQRQCHEFGKLSLGGSTILFGSGDSGVAGIFGCIDEETGNPDINGTKFTGCIYTYALAFQERLLAPTSPLLKNCTKVGATQMNPNSTVRDPELALNISGGGFSSMFPRPSYQRPVVDKYLENFVPEHAKGNFDTNGRGYPDLSSNGACLSGQINDEFFLVEGTSASTPVIAAMITAINDARMAVGKNPVGFINPTIYSERFQPAFNDITTGGNIGCEWASETRLDGIP